MSEPEKHTQQQSRFILGLVIFIMGGCGLAYEYTFSKIAADLIGNSVQQWAIVIAVMLFCMGMGAEIQKWISNKKLLNSLIYSQLLLATLGGFGPLLMLLAFSYFPYHFALVQYSLISVIGILIGFEIPLISRLNEAYSDNIRTNLATVLKMDYIGALIGALLWVFLLPKFFTLHETAYILAYISIFTALLCWFFFKAKSNYLPLIVSITTIAIITTGFLRSDQWSIHAEQNLYRDRVVFTHTSPYQHIVLTESLTGNLRCFINGHIQFSADDEHIYHEQLVHPAFLLNKNAKRILILGGGDGMAAREVLKYPQVEEIVLVDLDPAMTELATNHPILSTLNNNSLKNQRLTQLPAKGISASQETALTQPAQRRIKHVDTSAVKLTIRNIDASKYIRTATGQFDIIILDFPDPSGPELAKLYSLHFYGELKNKLAADGIIIQQSTSPYQAKEAFLCIGRTMAKAGFSTLPIHDHVPSFGEWGWWIASHSSIYSPNALKERLQQTENISVPTKYLTPDRMRAATYFGKNQLHSEFKDINTLSNSAVLPHYLSAWKN
ncbi:polyamine aminopropyltransferase [Rubritalea spongiae]|uniref:Polyamine aminopropyltransferase n=1 Tax=Rubritalea spongiae TaxID=430797 RepID=A0ABW5E2U9_9BACT